MQVFPIRRLDSEIIVEESEPWSDSQPFHAFLQSPALKSHVGNEE